MPWIATEAFPIAAVVFTAVYVSLIVGGIVGRDTYLSENSLLADYARSGYDEGIVDEMRRFGRINSDADFVDSLRDICDELLVSDNPQYTACIQKARSGDGSESLVLSAIRHNNKCGVSMSLALAGFFHRQRYWSRDLIFLFPSSKAALDKWLEEYHQGLKPIQAGSIQAAIVLDIPGPSCLSIQEHELALEGANGLLPNLDLVNLVAKVGSIKSLRIHSVQRASLGSLKSILSRTVHEGLFTLPFMLARQALGKRRSIHEDFLKYRIDAVTISGTGVQGLDSSMRRTFEAVEGVFRSLNNILEHLHQSFFFYLLTGPKSFVSIANYMPLPLALAVPFVIYGLTKSNALPSPMIMAIIALICIAEIGWMSLGKAVPGCRFLGLAFDLLARSFLLNDRKTLDKSAAFSLGCTGMGIGVALLAMTNASLAILFGLSCMATAFKSPLLSRLCLYVLSPILLFASTRRGLGDVWNFGIPFMLVYPSNLLMHYGAERD